MKSARDEFGPPRANPDLQRLLQSSNIREQVHAAGHGLAKNGVTQEAHQNAQPQLVRIPTKANTDSEGNANGIPGRRRTVFGAQRRWQLDCGTSVRLRQGKPVRSAAEEERL